MSEHLITREIGIDMGHRVTYHGSKCKNLHGHRYTIQATCAGPLFTAGEQQGMVLDFGFLKDIMLEYIDRICDHGTTLWVDDPMLEEIWHMSTDASHTLEVLKQLVALHGSFLYSNNIVFSKLYLVPFVPTAENLACHWFELMQQPVKDASDGHASLQQIKVWETPNCSATYPTGV